ncbi:hypothetical protein EJB05_46885, partial [Eragrostis curvula]
MAPKRKSPAPPPPVPGSEEEELVAKSRPTAAAAASKKAATPSKEVQSSDDSGSDDSEEVAAAASKKAPPPSKKVRSSDDSESEKVANSSSSSEGESDASSVPPSAAATKKTAPPPRKVQQPESSDEYEDDEYEEEEGGREVTKAATAPSTSNNPPPPNQEQPEEEDGALEPIPAAKQQAEGKGGKLPAITREWSKEDNVRILQALAAHRRKYGMLPKTVELEATLKGTLDRRNYSLDNLTRKINNMKASYTKYVSKGQEPSKEFDLQVYKLSKEVWGSDNMSANPRDCGEMCELYPHLAMKMKEVENEYPDVFKREFGMISDEMASALDTKVKKQKLLRIEADLLGRDHFKELVKVLTGLKDK